MDQQLSECQWDWAKGCSWHFSNDSTQNSSITVFERRFPVVTEQDSEMGKLLLTWVEKLHFGDRIKWEGKKKKGKGHRKERKAWANLLKNGNGIFYPLSHLMFIQKCKRNPMNIVGFLRQRKKTKSLTQTLKFTYVTRTGQPHLLRQNRQTLGYFNSLEDVPFIINHTSFA